MVVQLLTLIFLLTLLSHTTACQPTPITTQQVRTIAADPAVNAARLINVEPSRVPIVPAAPIQSLFELLRIPLPTLASIPPSSTTNNPLLNSTIEEDFNSTLSDSSINNNNSTGVEPELEPGNATESTNNLAKDLELAEQAVFGSLNDSAKDISKPTLKLFAAPDKNETKCTNAVITAITIMPYDDRLIGMDLDRVHEQVKLLEAYTQRTLSAFGEYAEEVANIDSKFALRYNIKKTTNCSGLRNFATKAVSYSREIDRVQFSCNCEPMWIIAKRKTPILESKNF